MKKLIKILAILLIGLIIALICVPYLFKDELVGKLKSEINKSVNATVDFDDIDISIFKSFPKISIDLKDLSIVGKTPFENQNLVNADIIRLHFDLISVLNKNKPIQLNSVEIIKPIADIRVNADGKANYDIISTSDSEDSSRDMVLDINHYAIHDGHISYHDKVSNLKFKAVGLNHSGSGNLSSNIYKLDTNTDIDDTSLTMDGVPYLRKVMLSSKSAIEVNSGKQEYTFNDASFFINQLETFFDGKVQLINSNTLIDMTFNSNKSTFKDLLSILPSAYTQDFESVDANGVYALEGKVNGIYSAENNTIPIVDIKLLVENGYVKYPDLALPIEGIHTSVFITSSTDKLADLKVNVPKFVFSIDGDPVEGHLYYSQPVSNPQIDAALKGKLNLGKFAQAYPIEDVTSLTGLVDIDVAMKGSQSDIVSQNYTSINMNGHLDLTDVNVQMKDMPSIDIPRMASQFSPQKIEIKEFKSMLGTSDITATGHINDPLGLILDDQLVTGSFDIQGNSLNLDEWITEEEEKSELSGPVDNLFDNVDISINGKVNSVQLSPYNIRNVEAVTILKQNNLVVEPSSFSIGKSDFKIIGSFQGLHEYLYQSDTLRGTLTGKSNKIVLEDFMVEPKGATATEAELPILPDNIDLQVNWSAQNISYDNIVITDATTDMEIEPSQILFQNFTGNSFGGKLDLDGMFNTFDPAAPGFSFKYNMAKMSFEKAIASVETLSILAPVAKYIDGIFNSTLMMDGTLTKDLLPDLNTLGGSGFLETLDGKIKGSNTLSKVKQLLSVNEIKEWTIKNSKNWFEIKDGKLEVKPFTFTYQDIGFTMEGYHSLNKSLNYVIHATVPKELLTQTQMGQVANKGLNAILAEVNKLGLNIDSGDQVEVDIEITGDITKPKLSFKPKGISSSGTINSAVDQKLEEVKTEIKDTVQKAIEQKKEEVRQQAEDKAEAVKDTVQKKVEQEVDKVVDQGKDRMKEILKEKTDSLLTPDIQQTIEEKIPDVIGIDSKSEIDSIKNKIKDWNPFKKKKKN